MITRKSHYFLKKAFATPCASSSVCFSLRDLKENVSNHFYANPEVPRLLNSSNKYKKSNNMNFQVMNFEVLYTGSPPLTLFSNNMVF